VDENPKADATIRVRRMDVWGFMNEILLLFNFQSSK
jgi:hypothetical protein